MSTECQKTEHACYTIIIIMLNSILFLIILLSSTFCCFTIFIIFIFIWLKNMLKI